MKCIQCETDNNLKDRTANQGRCKNCAHRFVFEPTAMGRLKITDPMFAKAIADISLNNTLFFTPKQLFYLLDNRLRKKSFNIVGLGCLYIFFSVWATGFIGGILSSVIGNNSFIIVLILYNLFCIFYLLNQANSSENNIKVRQNSARLLILLGIVMISGGILIRVSTINSFIFTIAAGMGLLSIYSGTTQLNKTDLKQEFLLDRDEFQQWFNRWQEINGSIEKLLPTPQQTSQSATIDSDITAYSFDRLIVCDRAKIAQILIANNFHFENNCAILSVTGYPQSIFEIVMEMVRRNQDIQVYALHDCSPRGIGLADRLRNSPQWFANTDTVIIDIGLTPRQIMATKQEMFVQSTPDSAQSAKELTSEIRQGLTSQEIEWLELGNFVELESFTPKRLIQVLNQCILRGDNFTDDNLMMNDTRNDMYLNQSFG